MAKPLTILILFFLGTCIFSQSALQLEGDVIEAFSSEKEDLSGILARPKFAPPPSQVFAFERKVEGMNHLYLYDVGAGSLTEVQTIFREAGVKLSIEDSILQSQLNNTQLDWRPVLDSQRRQWFAFISNGKANNQDIFIGFAGGTTYIRLTLDTADDYSPKWSPDGNSIAFTSERSGDGDIYLIEEVDEIINDLNRNASNFQLRRLTNSPNEETQLAWNPDPSAYLIAYAEKTTFSGRQVDTYQIRVIDITLPANNITKVTDDPLAHYTRPLWDDQTASKLLYIGKKLTEDESSNLYISELAWGENGMLKNKVFEGDKTEIFKNVNLAGTHALWLDGGEAVICQENRPQQNYPIYSVNVTRRLNQQERAIYYFGALHSAYPYILDYDVRNNNLIFVNQEGLHFKIYLTKIYGDDIKPTAISDYQLSNPREYGVPVPQEVAQSTAGKTPTASDGTTPIPGTGSIPAQPNGSNRRLWFAGGAAAAAGVVAIIILTQQGNGVTPQIIDGIGRPPSLPNTQ